MFRHIINTKIKLNLFRFRSTNAAESPIKYTDTINLPKTKFPPRLSAAKRAEVEQHLNKNYFSQLYKWQENNLKTKEFVLHDGPPYANGDLHMGHAINKILKDIILKYHIMNRTKVHFKPGWDCHGLPIELKALSTQKQLSPLETRKIARKFALTTIDKQKAEFQSWGITADMDNSENIYRSIDKDYVRNQLELFYQLYEKGLIYRDLKPVYWSPSSKTALAEAELEYDSNFESPSITLRLKMNSMPKCVRDAVKDDEQVFATIWTTTPWTLPTNQGICYNPELKYSAVKLNGKDGYYIVASSLVNELKDVNETVVEFVGAELIDSTYVHPINVDELLPFLPAKHVQATKGTGLVHTSPAHGPDDFLVALENKIPIKCFVNEDGLYSKDAPEFLQCKDALIDGSDLVIAHLNADILQSDKIQHSYPIDWRTKKPVIIRASNQWFIDTDRIKDAAAKKVAMVSFYPKSTAEANKANLVTQVAKRPFWCISRQRVWGTPIPVFYNRKTGATIVNRQIIEHLISQLDSETAADFWWTKKIDELIPDSVLAELNLKIEDIERGNDILDIWFDSGISWSYALNEPKIADLYLEGVDQFTGWFQSSLLTSIGLRNKAPYKSIFVHGFAVDEDGHKMSKSQGNIINPKTIISKYGLDTLRWWIAAHASQHASIPVSLSLLQSSVEHVQKLRSILKYLIGSLSPISGEDLSVEELIGTKIQSEKYLDNYFLKQLAEFEKEIFSIYETYQFNRATATILNFVSNELSGLYLHTIKDRLYCGTVKENHELQQILKLTYFVLNKVLWPITPFLVEECWSYYAKRPFYEENVNVPSEWYNFKYDEIIKTCLEHKTILHQYARDTNTWLLDATISCEMTTMMQLVQLHETLMEQVNDSELCELLQVSSINIVPTENLANNSEINTNRIDGTLCQRCRRFAIESDESICSRCEQVLAEKGIH